MQKTNKSVSKRFKVSANGKVLFRKAGRSHLLRKKSSKQRRGAHGDQQLAKGMSKKQIASLPFA